MIRRFTITAAALWAFAALALAPAAMAVGDNPHAPMNRADSCEDCHLTTPDRDNFTRPLKLKKDVVSICLECHSDKDVANLHPVDIRPDEAMVASGLPLDEAETITCATCHNPHSDFEAKRPYAAEALGKRLLSLFTRKKSHRTFYLRLPNDEGQLCAKCHDRSLIGKAGFHVSERSMVDQYAGSARCGQCHREDYDRWKITPHARMARDPKTDPQAVLADFENNPPFALDDVVYVIGSRWTQRYVVEKKGKLLVKAPIWSIQTKEWDRSYWIDKPWDLHCQGCHTTGFELIDEPRFVELGIGCESCHGPGLAHSDSDGEAPIVNPAAIDPDRREMICESCHTSGHDRTGQFRYPMGYLPGEDLTLYYQGLMPKPGQDNETFMGDESYEDRRNQWNFWIESYMNARGITCDICKNFRTRTKKTEKPKMSVAQHCATCHGDEIAERADHRLHQPPAIQCDACHIPQPGGNGNYSIHDHKFLFTEPVADKPVEVGETCVNCHADGKGG